MATELSLRHVPTIEIGEDQRVLSKTDQQFWQENNPTAIVFASSSLRKGILLAFALAGYSREAIQRVPLLEELPFDPKSASTPLEFQQLLEKHIPNGDGELKGSVYVGEFRGIPVYMVPQQGETDKNDDPLIQSINKVIDVQGSLAGKRVLIFGSDSTGLVNGEHLGKPRYYSDRVGRFERGVRDVDFTNPEEVAQYCEAYLLQFYSQDTTIVHNNAIFAAMYGTDSLQSAYQETSLEQTIINVKQRLATLQVYLDAGGGGIFQQLVDWLDDIHSQLSDVVMREVIAQLPEEQQPWAVIAHIMGMPAWALPGLVEELVGRKSFRIV